MSTAVQAASNTGSGMAAYARRVPEDTILYGVVSHQLMTFFGHAENSGRTVPAFVERELTRYLECSILAYGFVRVCCAACRYDRGSARDGLMINHVGYGFSRSAAAGASRADKAQDVTRGAPFAGHSTR
jgi:hypothetical protein